MANYQAGYGHGDVFGIPFDFYAGATVVTGSTIVMQTASLVVLPTGTLAALTVVLPLNPVDGAFAEIVMGQIITALTIQANTGDVLVAGILGQITTVGAFTPVASAAAGNAAGTVRYRYTLNGFQPASGAAVNPRSWVRVQ